MQPTVQCPALERHTANVFALARRTDPHLQYRMEEGPKVAQQLLLQPVSLLQVGTLHGGGPVREAAVVKGSRV